MLKLYNSLTRTKDEFKSIQPGKVGLYTCGPTVYDYQHIGNFRTFIIWDVLKRYLTKRGFAVKHIMNITDVGHLTSDSDEGEDKMEVAKYRERKSAWEVAEFFTDIFKKDSLALGIIPPDKYVTATESINDQIAMAMKLDEAGYLYKIRDGMYFDTSKLKDYGKLAQINKIDIEQVRARVAPNVEKRNPTDFAVWKFSPHNEKRDMEWESPWGKGFPGWHLECSAISMENLGETFDIHTGGVDHLTIHHPNEMAQSEAVTGKIQAKWWMHSQFLNMGEDKMSKSLGTFITFDDFRKQGIPPIGYRFFVLQTHYRKQLQFSWEAVKAAWSGLNNIYDTVSYFEEPGEVGIKELETEFFEAMDNDLSTPIALSVLQRVLTAKYPSKQKMFTINVIDEVLGLRIMEQRKRRRVLPQVAYPILEDRRKARLEGNWKRSDSLRKELDKLGVTVKDTEEGQLSALSR